MVQSHQAALGLPVTKIVGVLAAFKGASYSTMDEGASVGEGAHCKATKEFLTSVIVEGG